LVALLAVGIVFSLGDEKSFFKHGKKFHGSGCNFDDCKDWGQNGLHKKIATALTPKSTPLTEALFQDGDLILFGNERVGLSEQVMATCDESVIIPMLGAPYIKEDRHPGQPIKGVGEYPTFNTSHAHAIVMYTAMAQLEQFRNFEWGNW